MLRPGDENRKANRWRPGAAALAVVALTVLPGCAARGGSLAGRFVKPGEPAMSFDTAPAPTEARGGRLAEYARQVRTLQANARANVHIGATYESRDRQLAGALLRLSIAPTAVNHRLAADAYRRAGITDYAYKHLKRALAIAPCDSRAHEGLAQLWRNWGQPELALTEAHRAVYCAPASVSAQNTLGTVLAALGQLKPAQRAFETAVRLDGSAVFALNNLCYSALQEGDGLAAQQACERTLAVDPTLAAAQANLALAYALQGNIEQAEGRLLDNDDAALGLYNVGILRLSLRQYGEAAAAFEQASAERPSLAEAARRAVQARAKTAATKER